MKQLSAQYKYFCFSGTIWNLGLAVFAWQEKLQQNRTVYAPTIASPKGNRKGNAPSISSLASLLGMTVLLANFGKIASHFTLRGHYSYTMSISCWLCFLSRGPCRKKLPATEGYRRKRVLFIKGLLLQFIFFMERKKISLAINYNSPSVCKALQNRPRLLFLGLPAWLW